MKLENDCILSTHLFEKACNKMGYSLEDIARYLGYKTHKSILDIKAGKKSLKLSELISLCYLLGRHNQFHCELSKEMNDA